MSTASTSTISAAEWLDIRDHVARKVKQSTSGQMTTCVNIAEKLLRDGYIDIDVVLAKIKPAPVEPADINIDWSTA